MFWTLSLAALAQTEPPTPDVPTGLNAQAYRPPMDSERTLWADDSGTILKKATFKARLFGHYVHNPLVFYPSDDGPRTVIVGQAMQLDVVAMFHINRFRFGVDLPIYLLAAGDLTDDGPGLGDLALDGRVTILDHDDNPVGAAIGGRLTLPTATTNAPLGWGGLSGEVFGILDSKVDRLLLTMNIGGRFVTKDELLNVTLNDQLFARLGAGYQLVDDAGISLDFNGSMNLTDPANIAGLPVEGLIGGWGRAGRFVIRGGVGTGLTPGITAPDFRGILSFGYEPRPDRDPDGDGLVGSEDQCPEQPEDPDRFEDLDGCPDPDNDQDGVLDSVDACPLDPEDVDNYMDDDGCPDFTSQIVVKVQQQNGRPVPRVTSKVTGEATDEKGTGNYVLDLHEGTYTVTASAEDFVTNELAFTVPLPDGAEEVILVLQPDVITGELTVKVQDDKGNPLPDPIWYVDGGVGPAPINGGQVTVSLPAGEHALDVRHEGFITDRRSIVVPEKASKEVVVQLQPSQVQVTAEKIDIRDSVYFDTAKATIQARSFGLLDNVASVLADHPEILRVRIEGHTDSRGGAAYNKKLSDDRARSVMNYLIGKGIEAGRLESIGYGEEKPLDPREVPEAWEKNRRVDFFIVERSDE